jgi:hypothetical protein
MKQMTRWMLTAAALAACGLAAAKLPPPDEATKAKAAEAAAKSAWQGKVDTYQLCKAQDRIAAKYKSSHPAAAKPAASGASAAAAAPAAKTPVPTAASASQGGSTPALAVVSTAPAIPTCADPGPFAGAPAAQKPLETSGAHSPTATAASPPSVRSNSAEMAPSKPSTGPAKK